MPEMNEGPLTCPKDAWGYETQCPNCGYARISAQRSCGNTDFISISFGCGSVRQYFAKGGSPQDRQSDACKITQLEQRSDLQRKLIQAMEKLLDDATYYEPAVQQALWAKIRTLREKLAHG